MYCIYDTKDYEQCVGIFETVKEVAEYFDTTTNAISTIISRKQKRGCRYLIVRVEGGTKE